MTVLNNSEKCYLMLDSFAEVDTNNESKLKENIEKGNKEMKLKCLKSLIVDMAAAKGNKVSSSLLMVIIRFLSPQSDHEMKKLLLLFWELLPKTQPNGNLITEMILVVDSYRRDLENPNEYIRSFTLRFLCKVNNCEILESLMPSIKQCLRHNKNFVRKNAIVAVCTIYRKFPHLIANAPELILNYLSDEHDSTCIRSAFLMLLQVEKTCAVGYLKQCLPKIFDFDSTLQLVTIEVMLKSSQIHPSDRNIFFPVINSLMMSNKTSNAVKYDAANALVILSAASATIKRVVECYIQLMFQESDNNIRLVLLGKIKTLIKQCQSNELKNMIATFSMDILSLLTSQSGEDVVVDLSVAECILSGVQFLMQNDNTTSCMKATEIIIREIVKLHSRTNMSRRDVSMGKLTPSEIHMVKYMNLLIDTVYHFSEKCPEISSYIIPVLVETIYYSHQDNALSVLNLIRLHIVKNPNEKVFELLIGIVGMVPSLMILQEIFIIFIFHCKSGVIIEKLLSKLHSLLVNPNDPADASSSSIAKNTYKSNLILPDGTYALTTTPLNDKLSTGTTATNCGYGLFMFAHSKDIAAYSFITLVSFLMVHCVVIIVSNGDDDDKAAGDHCINKCVAMAIFIVTSLLENVNKQHSIIKGYWREKIHANLHIINSLNDSLVNGDAAEFQQKIKTYSQFFDENHTNLNLDNITTTNDNINDQWSWADIETTTTNNNYCVKVNSPMDFSSIFTGFCSDDDADGAFNESKFKLQDYGGGGGDGDDGDDLVAYNNNTRKSTSALNNVIQLTGLSDPIYVETITLIKSFQVTLDVLIVNRTNDTLQNVVVEVVTHGKNSTFAKSDSIMLAPFAYAATTLPIKVMSLENGTLYGNLFYDISSSQSDRNCIVLNPIYLDVTDYTKPFSCSQNEFLAKWKDLDWENTIHIKTECSDMLQFMENILKSTKMVNLTPQKSLEGDCNFLVCNSGIISSFNEEALVNISMEKINTKTSTSIGGIIRIRAGTEDMVLNIGEKIKRCMNSF